MAVSEETIQALADAVAGWRLQECVYISFFCLYVYYVLTTMAEDVSIILPQKWNRGKTLHMTIRYGLIVFIAVQLISENYFLISPNACKALFIIWNLFNFVVKLTCNFTLGICLGALLQTNTLYLAAIVVLSCGVTLVNAVISVVSTIQYPAEPISPLDAELGYPCVVPSGEQWSALTIAYTGRDVRAYVNLVTTTLLSLMGVITLAVRYRGQGGRLIQVLRRDGGVYYLSLLAIRLAEAIVRTPTVVSVSALDGSPAYL
ncbi:hypothetical protein FA13DRAFT_774572 [Coprinellus micaceus]|uniref:Transmembrane protein n=1 Tax=Coprinellus micaceus TaxID=71717 RepID=A0A4Y7T3X0_COPMI|nr:hypothetical protein FA13DRAFT_774572 [Coprinellus micaceus]